METIKEVWSGILDYLHNLDDISEVAYNVWITCIEPRTIEDGEVVVFVHTNFQKKIVSEHYADKLKDAFENVLGIPLGLKIVSGEDLEKTTAAAPPPASGNLFDGSTDQDYSFENFVVGSSNKFAHAASQAVASKPAGYYNPLFIYGGSGLGKTHLLYAICNEIRKNSPAANILFTKGEYMANELIEAIQKGQTMEFRAKYRQVDVLLIDDIQFISGKVSTQEEFFHTFDALHQANKQIVLTSDRPPNEMVRLEDRLRTRFEWGLLADIQPPDYETRMAIIKNKAVNLGFDLPDDVCNYIAENITNNVRQIEGTVKKIKAFKELNGMVLDVPNVARAIKDMFKGKTENLPTPSLIVSEVCQYYGIEEQVLRSTLKNKNTAEARQVAMYLIRTMTNLSLPEIGREFDRDHTTVMHGLKKVEQTLQNSASPLNDTIRDITANVNNKL